MTDQDKRDSQLIAVSAVEAYAAKHGLTTTETVALFRRSGLFDMLRDHYGVLHTLDLDEGAAFAEDVLGSRHAR